MKLLTVIVCIACIASLSQVSFAFTQEDYDALLAVPCDVDKRQFFHNCTEGPDCYNCMVKGSDVCDEKTKIPNDTSGEDNCNNCLIRASYIYCRVNPFNPEQKIPADAPIPKSLQNSDAFKGRLNNTSSGPTAPVAANGATSDSTAPSNSTASSAPSDSAAAPPAPNNSTNNTTPAAAK